MIIILFIILFYIYLIVLNFSRTNDYDLFIFI